MTDQDRYLKIIEELRRQTAERLADPEKLRDYIRSVHGPELRTLEDEEASQMLVLLQLTGSYANTNNQRTSTYFYKYSEREYRVTYGLSSEPLVEEVLPYDV